jgi:hypothetical protein
MKTAFNHFIYAAAALVSSAGICHAQTTDLKPAPARVIIDGNAAEWGDLPYTDDKAKINYTISNDKNNLYLVVKTKDTVKQSNILGSGITFSINTKGRKTTTYWTTFPIRGKEDPGDYQKLDPTQTQAKIALTKYRKMEVKGFADITDARLDPSNVYGIQVAMGYDDAGYLVYEETIPLVLFHTGNSADKEWAFNICINGLLRDVKSTSTLISRYKDDAPPSGGTVYNTPQAFRDEKSPNDGARPVAIAIDNHPPGIVVTPPVDFWVKSNLAK